MAFVYSSQKLLLNVMLEQYCAEGSVEKAAKVFSILWTVNPFTPRMFHAGYAILKQSGADEDTLLGYLRLFADQPAKKDKEFKESDRREALKMLIYTLMSQGKFDSAVNDVLENRNYKSHLEDDDVLLIYRSLAAEELERPGPLGDEGFSMRGSEGYIYLCQRYQELCGPASSEAYQFLVKGCDEFPGDPTIWRARTNFLISSNADPSVIAGFVVKWMTVDPSSLPALKICSSSPVMESVKPDLFLYCVTRFIDLYPFAFEGWNRLLIFLRHISDRHFSGQKIPMDYFDKAIRDGWRAEQLMNAAQGELEVKNLCRDLIGG